MNEVKTPKKPLVFYYGIAMVVLLLLNMLVMPLITQHQVEEVDYGTFIKMTENKEIGQVETTRFCSQIRTRAKFIKPAF